MYSCIFCGKRVGLRRGGRISRVSPGRVERKKVVRTVKRVHKRITRNSRRSTRQRYTPPNSTSAPNPSPHKKTESTRTSSDPLPAPLHIPARKLLHRLVRPKMDRMRGAGAHDDGGHAAPERARALGGRDAREGVPDPGVDGRGGGCEYLHSGLVWCGLGVLVSFE